MSAGIKQTPGNTAENPSLPNSRRVYIDGKLPGVRVPFREITQNQSRNFDGTLVANPPLRVYDTSGPWGDPNVHCDVREGLPQLRREWISARDDVEEYQGREAKPIDDGYLTFDAATRARVKDVGRLEDFPTMRRTVLRAKPGACVTQLHYARRGIITPEMEFIAIRENLGREAAFAIWTMHHEIRFFTNIADSRLVQRFRSLSRPNLCVRKLRVDVRSFLQTSTILSRSR